MLANNRLGVAAGFIALTGALTSACYGETSAQRANAGDTTATPLCSRLGVALRKRKPVLG
jgi:hypothetical protein